MFSHGIHHLLIKAPILNNALEHGRIYKYVVTNYFIRSPFSFIGDVLISGLTLAAGYTGTKHFAHLLKGNDISYGIYIYHMLVINFMVYRNLLEKPHYLLIAFLATIVFAFASWKLIEQPVLRDKKKTLNQSHLQRSERFNRPHE